MNSRRNLQRADSRASLIVCALLISLLATAGCWDRSAASKKSAKKSPDSAAATSDAAEAGARASSGVHQQKSKQSADSSPDSPKTSADAGSHAAAVKMLNASATRDAKESPAAADGAAENAAVEQQQQAPTDRFAILTPGGPLILDLRITLDGRPLEEPLKEIVDQAMQAGDTDGDGNATWQEFTANREYLEGPAVGLAEGDARQPRMWIDQFDYNDDGVLQRDEAAAWLGRGSGASARSLALRSSRSGSADPRWSSRIWKLVDVDRSGDLSTDEIDRAAAALRARDEDDNQIVTQPELAALIDQLEASTPMMSVPRSEASRDAAIRIRKSPDVDRLDYLLVNLYAPRQYLGPTSFRALPSLFEQLDGDGDEWLGKDELGALGTVQSHLAIDLDFPDAKQGDSTTPKLTVRHYSHELEHIAQSDDRIVLALGATRLVVAAQDFAPQANEGQQTARSQVSLMVHDQCDALFEALDANSDGRLGDREISNCAAQLLRSDVDGDGRLVPGELPNSMIIALSRAEPSRMDFYVPRSAPAAVVAEAPQWFVANDFNGDGDLSRREFLGTDEQFAKLDANSDGFVDADEASAYKTSSAESN